MTQNQIKIVSEHIEHQLTREQMFEIISLLYSVWPKSNISLDKLVEENFVSAQNNPDDFTRRYVVWENKKAVAHAKIFPRTILTGLTKIEIAALTAVCVSESRRGAGFGKLIIESVFHYIKDCLNGVTLFQTNVPDFYKKLSAIEVKNRFVNRLNITDPHSNPWWEDHIMIYPGDFPFPSTEIDLNGPGY